MSSDSNSNSSSSGNKESNTGSDRNGALVEASMANCGCRTRVTPMPGYLAMPGPTQHRSFPSHLLEHSSDDGGHKLC